MQKRTGEPHSQSKLPMRLMLFALIQAAFLVHGYSQVAQPTPSNAAGAIRQRADQGDPEAQFELGTLYDSGVNVEQNSAEAVRWYLKAAEQGNALAEVNLGSMYLAGKGIIKNLAEAVRWYSKAADQGEASGQFALGMMYSRGEGVPKNDSEALQLYRKAAERGFPPAQDSLASMYLSGTGVALNVTEGVHWIERAAYQGDPTAQYNLAYFYADGRGVPRDGVQALMWGTLSTTGMAGDAKTKASSLVRSITLNLHPQQQEEASRLAKNWKPKKERPPDDAALPSAETVLDKYVEVTGGQAAYAKLHTQILNGTLQVGDSTAEANPMICHKTSPGSSHCVIRFGAIESIEATNGQVVWSQGRFVESGLNVSLKTYGEKALGLYLARFMSDGNWRDLYWKAQTAGIDYVKGQQCYKIVLTLKDPPLQFLADDLGPEITRYYDTSSNLLVKTALIVKMPKGNIPVELLVSDYRKEGDILMPLTTVQNIPGKPPQVMTIQGVTHNAPIPSTYFALPDQVKALLTNKK
jgi:TPR repeat protein